MIYLNINCVYAPAQCYLTREYFDCDEILAFFYENDLSKPVCPDWALVEGFTVDHETYIKLNEIVFDYLSKHGEI